jgi:hypothetical protein
VILSLDPGKKEAGVALWKDGELALAWLARGNKKTAELLTWHLATAKAVYQGLVEHGYHPDSVDTFVGEKPEIYKAQFQKGEQQSVADLSLVTGAVAGLVQPRAAVVYLPKEWKRQVPKHVVTRRIIGDEKKQGRLSQEEQSRIELPAPSLRHNVYDAIGIGLKYLKRWWC